MKCNFKQTKDSAPAPLDRKQRREIENRIRPIAKRIVQLEKQIRSGENKAEAEQQIANLMADLSFVEMLALQHYIETHNLLPQQVDNQKK